MEQAVESFLANFESEAPAYQGFLATHSFSVPDAYTEDLNEIWAGADYSTMMDSDPGLVTVMYNLMTQMPWYTKDAEAVTASTLLSPSATSVTAVPASTTSISVAPSTTSAVPFFSSSSSPSNSTSYNSTGPMRTVNFTVTLTETLCSATSSTPLTSAVPTSRAIPANSTATVSTTAAKSSAAGLQTLAKLVTTGLMMSVCVSLVC